MLQDTKTLTHTVPSVLVLADRENTDRQHITHTHMHTHELYTHTRTHIHKHTNRSFPKHT